MNFSKTAILCPIWKRRELVRVVLAYYRDLQKDYGFRFIASVSEKDFPQEWLTGWAEVVRVENLPIGRKINKLARLARLRGCEQAVIIGSDDFISRGVMNWYSGLELEPKTVYGFKSIHFYRWREDELTYWDFHDRIGLGRVLPLDVLEVSPTIWPPGLNKGLDRGSLQTYTAHGYRYKSVCSQDTGGMLLDVKYADNISPDWVAAAGRVEDVNRLYDFFPEGLVDEIRNLPYPQKKL
jgi:hypothetical protein